MHCYHTSTCQSVVSDSEALKIPDSFFFFTFWFTSNILPQSSASWTLISLLCQSVIYCYEFKTMAKCLTFGIIITLRSASQFFICRFVSASSTRFAVGVIVLIVRFVSKLMLMSSRVFRVQTTSYRFAQF